MRHPTENPDIRYSEKVNSDGDALTEGQAEYFKDSKIRDEDGNLLVVYHGSSEDFTVFDRTKSRANMDIQGNFFSPWEIDAGGYGGNVRAFYLNIKNPASESMGYKALNKFKGQNYAGVKAREYLESLGYDGVNNGNEEYIAFYPEQIKEISNENPTEDSDIRYSEKVQENPSFMAGSGATAIATKKEIKYSDKINLDSTEQQIGDMIIREGFYKNVEEAKHATRGIIQILSKIRDALGNYRANTKNEQEKTFNWKAIGITNEFVHKGFVDFKAKNLSTDYKNQVAEIATLAMIWRNPQFETHR